jgi:hypothetical protein
MVLCLALLLTLSAPGEEGSGQPEKKPSAARLHNAEAVRRQLGLLPAYANVAGLRSVKVAVLDHGFDGVESRPYLPADTVVVQHYDPEFVRRFNLGDPAFQKPFVPGNSHGRSMAQLVWAVTGFSPHGPHFYLLNANGPTLFRRAIRYAIEQKVDVLLFAGNFEGAGNYDGRGSINAIVDEAIAAGILWVNAAGNSGGSVYNGPIKADRQGYVRLGKGDSTALRFRNLLDENAVTITLTWNDYRNDEDAGTDKDLDLYVEDDRGRLLGSSELRQVKDRPAGTGESRNPRERVVLSDLAAAPGREYRIRVKAHSSNFTSRDRLRILVTAQRDTPFRDPKTGKITRPVQLLDASEEGEVYPPADHPGVITVGEGTRYSSIGPTSDGRVKPDVVIADATAQFSNGEETTGSSNAAAFFAGVVALMKAVQPGLQTRHVLALARRSKRPASPPSAPRADAVRAPAPQGSVYRSPYQPPQQGTSGVRPNPSGQWTTATPTRAPDRSQPSRPPSAASQSVPRQPPPRPPWRTPSPERLDELLRAMPY